VECENGLRRLKQDFRRLNIRNRRLNHRFRRLNPENRRLKPRLSDLHIKTRLDLGAGPQQIGVEIKKCVCLYKIHGFLHFFKKREVAICPPKASKLQSKGVIQHV
jgi:hypothetical protein